ncbi:MAG: alpha-amylase family glycosyl hydrolase [Holdemania massiliensis]
MAAMGFDYLYLLPIHPIGVQQRKGDLGSPYAISDYWAINPEYGTLEDFKQLIQAVHDHHMKIMIDIVINHTAYDHPFTQTHPEYYYHRPEGNFGNRVGDWTDILDLNYSCEALREEMINMLCYWQSWASTAIAATWPVWCRFRSGSRRQKLWRRSIRIISGWRSVEPEFIRALRSEGF